MKELLARNIIIWIAIIGLFIPFAYAFVTVLSYRRITQDELRKVLAKTEAELGGHDEGATITQVSYVPFVKLTFPFGAIEIYPNKIVAAIGLVTLVVLGICSGILLHWQASPLKIETFGPNPLVRRDAQQPQTVIISEDGFDESGNWIGDKR